MRKFVFVPFLIAILASCNNKAEKASTPFCTAPCGTDSLKFKGESKFKPEVAIGLKDCNADTLVWGHYLMDFNKTLGMEDFLGQKVKLNPAAVSCVIKDTSVAWLTFNDCNTGRGYLLKLPFSKKSTIGKYTGALNSFDPKFSVEKDLRAYTDRGSIFVINIENGKEAGMTFREYYDIDFNDLHKVVDSINVTSKRIYVKLLKNGNPVEIEKQIEL
jgi:hypothetical protein